MGTGCLGQVTFEVPRDTARLVHIGAWWSHPLVVLVTLLDARFKVYSGLLDVPGPVCGYDLLKIHYQFHTSQNDPAKEQLTLPAKRETLQPL
eukprot:688064-Amphidinium_carterae.1